MKMPLFIGFVSLFPACAGVIPGRPMCARLQLPFPRMRGGDPRLTAQQYDELTFSPHARGVIPFIGNWLSKTQAFQSTFGRVLSFGCKVLLSLVYNGVVDPKCRGGLSQAEVSVFSFQGSPAALYRSPESNLPEVSISRCDSHRCEILP